jgi:hypothetical protein
LASGHQNSFWPTSAQSQAADHDPLAQHAPRDGTGSHAHRRLARRGPPAAAIVANSVFPFIGDVGMARPEALGDFAVILGPLVLILDVQRDGRARRAPLEDAGEDADLIRLLPLRHEFRGARLPLVQEGLDPGLVQLEARWAAVDDAADGRAVALAPGGDAEEVAEAVVTHGPSS